MPVNLPNMITIVRLVLVPFVVAMIGRGTGRPLLRLRPCRRLGWRRRLPRPAFQHALGARRLSRSDRRQAAAGLHLHHPGLRRRNAAVAGHRGVCATCMIVGAVVLSWLIAHPVEIKPSSVQGQYRRPDRACGRCAGRTAFAVHLDPLRPALILLSGLDHGFGRGLSRGWLRHMSGYGSHIGHRENGRCIPRPAADRGMPPRSAGRSRSGWLARGLRPVLYVFSDILLPFVAGMVLAYFLDPVADRLQRFGLSRFMATVVILVIFLIVRAGPSRPRSAAGTRWPNSLAILPEFLTSGCSASPPLSRNRWRQQKFGVKPGARPEFG